MNDAYFVFFGDASKKTVNAFKQSRVSDVSHVSISWREKKGGVAPMGFEGG